MRYESLVCEARTSPTFPEPLCDILAQLRVLRDKDHPKKTVFIASGTSVPRDALNGLYIVERPEGVFVTTDFQLWSWLRIVGRITDTDMARILGYPEPKSHAIEANAKTVIQALDADGCVVFEAGCSDRGRDMTIEAALVQIPEGGRLSITNIASVLARRIAGI